MPRYTTQGIVYKLGIHEDAKADLVEIGKRAPDVEKTILALLQEIKASQWWLESLTIEEFGAYEAEKIHVDKWEHEISQGRNIWRFKAWNLESLGLKYRVIYCLDPRTSFYLVLAVIPRSINYDPKHPRVIKLEKLYDSLGIARLR